MSGFRPNSREVPVISETSFIRLKDGGDADPLGLCGSVKLQKNKWFVKFIVPLKEPFSVPPSWSEQPGVWPRGVGFIFIL